jgi:hypothetical protein
LPHITNVLWDGIFQKSDMMCREMLGEQYCRVNPVFEKEFALDSPSGAATPTVTPSLTPIHSISHSDRFPRRARVRHHTVGGVGQEAYICYFRITAAGYHEPLLSYTYGSSSFGTDRYR